MNLAGRFIIESQGGLIVPNRVTLAGAEAIARMSMLGDNTIVANPGNFYVGMCNQAVGVLDTLADISTEPDSTGGYARKAVARSNVGWPTVDVVNERVRLVSLLLTFEAETDPYSQPVTRLFITNVASGTDGILFAASAPLPNPTTITPGGEAFTARYELYLR